MIFRSHIEGEWYVFEARQRTCDTDAMHEVVYWCHTNLQGDMDEEWLYAIDQVWAKGYVLDAPDAPEPLEVDTLSFKYWSFTIKMDSMDDAALFTTRWDVLQ